jgi:4-amino-4-deoxy-L-arabinose transferase-like glycosyltransferase
MGASHLYSSNRWLLALIAAWVGLGLFGHDPWKPDEAYTFGLVFHILQTGDWVVPTLAGEPFMEKPPLFFITAAIFAQLFGWALPLHDGARLASAFYVGLTLLLTALTARKLFGERASFPAALLLIACFGYVHHAHLLITDNALVAGMAMGLYGFSISQTKIFLGGLLVGTGAGIAFLSKGLLGPGLLGLTAIALLAIPAWRSSAFVKSWLWATLAFAPWAMVWPWLLWRQSPELFHEWFWVQNLGRFTGTHQIGGVPDHWHYVKALPWFALPAWPIAAWMLFSQRKAIFSKTEIQLPLVAFLVMFAVLSASSLARQIYALPMLLPLCVLAAGGLDSLPVWLRRPLDILGVWGAAVLGLALWLLWFAFFAGWPTALAARLDASAPGFAPAIVPALFILATLITIGWAWWVRTGDLATRWAAGITLVWGLAMTLWLPYLDYTKTYRGVIADMQGSLPAGPGCITAGELTEPQRAVFHYFAGILKSEETKDCPLLLLHTSSDKPPQTTEGWKLIWRGTRPGDDRERFWLFSR